MHGSTVSEPLVSVSSMSSVEFSFSIGKFTDGGSMFVFFIRNKFSVLFVEVGKEAGMLIFNTVESVVALKQVLCIFGNKVYSFFLPASSISGMICFLSLNGSSMLLS